MLKRRTLSWDRDTERTLNWGVPAWSESARARSNSKSSLGYHDLLREIELTGGFAYDDDIRLQAFSGTFNRIEKETDREERPEVKEVFVITNAGLLVERYSYTETTPIDGDIFSGMLKAVQCFVEDSFGSHRSGSSAAGTGGLKELRMGNLEILITQGKYLTLVVIAKSGGNMRILEPGLKETLSRFESGNKKALRSWFGDRGAITGLREALDKVLLNDTEE